MFFKRIVPLLALLIAVGCASQAMPLPAEAAAQESTPSVEEIKNIFPIFEDGYPDPVFTNETGDVIFSYWYSTFHSLDETIDFYKSELPKEGWVLVSEEQYDGAGTELFFSLDEKELKVRMSLISKSAPNTLITITAD